ncbi:MAG: hypothetical protein ACREJF_01490 [Candidatus Methylomirabilales bacterium]
MLEIYGLKLVEETEYHWGFYWEERREIILLPKEGMLVSIRVKNHICGKLGIDLKMFVELYNQATAPESTPPKPS